MKYLVLCALLAINVYGDKKVLGEHCLSSDECNTQCCYQGACRVEKCLPEVETLLSLNEVQVKGIIGDSC